MGIISMKKARVLNFGKEICALNQKVPSNSLNKFEARFEKWEEFLEISFLSDKLKEKYFSLLLSRWGSTILEKNLPELNNPGIAFLINTIQQI